MYHSSPLRRIFTAFVAFFLVLSGVLQASVPVHAASEDVYRWRNDNGSEASATFAAAQNTSLGIVKNDQKRLRMGVAGTAADHTLTRGEYTNLSDQILQSNTFGASVIDTTNGFAYYATATAPSQIVKVQLSTFTVIPTSAGVTALVLAAGEDTVRAAVIDTAAGFAYFATGTSPAKIVKVNLATFTRVGSITLSAGENDIRSAVIDPVGGFAYFGTNTSPGIVVKVNLATFTRTDAVTLSAGENILTSAVIESDFDTAYFGTSTSPGIVVKMNLSSFTRTSALTLSAGENILTSAVIESDNDFAYFGTTTTAGRVVKVQLSDFTRVSAITLNAGENSLISATIDSLNGFAYFGTSTSPGRVVKVQLSDFTRVAALTLSTGENTLATAVIDTAGGFVYFATSTTPGRVVKIQLSDFTRSLSMSLNTIVDVAPVFDFIEHEGFFYFTILSSPGAVVKYDYINNLPVAYMSLDIGENSAATIMLDTTNGFGYVSLDTLSTVTPSKIIKFNLATFSRVASLTLNVNEGRPLYGILDVPNGFGYYAISGEPTIVKINLASLTRVGTLTIPELGAFIPKNSIVDGFLYVVSTDGVSVNDVLKVDLSTFSIVDTVSLGGALSDGIMDPVRKILYVISYTNFVDPAILKRVDLSTFSVTGSTTLSGTVIAVNSGIDLVHNFMYFNAFDAAFDLSMTEFDLTTLAVAEASAAPADTADYNLGFIDQDTGLAYQFPSVSGDVFMQRVQIFEPREFRLEYGVKTSTCSAISVWTQVPASATTEAWSMADSTSVVNGSATTDLVELSNVGATSFVAGNSMDTSSQTAGVALTRTSEFTELEYTVVPTANASASAYCFRLTDAGDAVDFTFATFAEAGIDSGGTGSSCPAPFVSIVAPNGGEQYRVGETQTIIWNFGGCTPQNVRISLSADGGVSYPTILENSVPANQNFYRWNITDNLPKGETMRLRVTLLDVVGAELVSDDSNGNFSILAATGTGNGTGVVPTDLSGRTGVYSPPVVIAGTPTIAVDKDLPVATTAFACAAGSLIKLMNDNDSLTQVDSAVYYCGQDGKRYVFPNEKTFKTWYSDFSSVVIVSADAMASLPIGGNVTQRPGVHMVKIQTDPKVYVVARGGVLRHVPDETTARALYGANWATLVDDVADTFFVNYTIGTPLQPSVVALADFQSILKILARRRSSFLVNSLTR